MAKRYISSSMKRKLTLKGLGKLYRAAYDELEKDSTNSGKTLANAAYKVGLDLEKA